MSLSQPEIERIVREVMRRLESPAAAADGAPCPSAAPASRSGGAAETPAAEQSDEGPATLSVDQRLVTFELLRGSLASLRRVRVRPDAVVTPLARDELKERRIELVRGAEPLANAAHVPVVLGVCWAALTNTGGRHLEAALRECGARVEATFEGEETQVIPRVTEALADGRRLGVLISGQPAAAACWANRSAGVRGVYGTEPGIVRQAVRAMAANLLLVCPRSELAPLLQAFLRPGPWTCPEPWNTRLHAGL